MIKHTFLFLAFCTACMLYACRQAAPPAGDKAYIELMPIKTELGWGYEIYVDNKLYIKQEYIPAINGRHGFKTKDDAMRTGKIVFDKLSHGKIPLITADELQQNNIRP